MYHEHYLIHKDDYIRHIDEKIRLYTMAQQLIFLIGKLPANKKNEALRRAAGRYAETIAEMFKAWGIPGSYLVFSEESDLAELMENELIAPKDAGYIPCEACPCADCETEDCGEDRKFAEALSALVSVLRSAFGDHVSVHIVVD